RGAAGVGVVRAHVLHLMGAVQGSMHDAAGRRTSEEEPCVGREGAVEPSSVSRPPVRVCCGLHSSPWESEKRSVAGIAGALCGVFGPTERILERRGRGKRSVGLPGLHPAWG